MRNQWVRALVGYVWGLALFLGIAWLLKQGLASSTVQSAVVSQIVLKGTLILVALAGWLVLRRPYREMGWCRIERWRRSDLWWFALSAIAMMVASFVMIFLEVRHPLLAQMSFAEVVVIVWFGSSLSEEIYVRGLVQSWISGRENVSAGNSAFEPAVISSALVFASMHVPLMRTSMGVKGGLPIVLATLVVGWACAVLRARTRSLWPAIACHILGNVAGIPGGILGVLVYRLVYGHFPDFIKPG
jgi:membrane protease YdiL (CAAX protease family)